MQRHHMRGPSLWVMQWKVGVLKPTVAVHDIGTLFAYDPAHRCQCAWIRERWVERARRVSVKGRQCAAPSADAEDAHTVEHLLGGVIAGLKCYDSYGVAEVHQFAGEGLYVAFETSDDGSVEIAQLEDMHKRLRSGTD
jgi:hypothetical protein